jgi:DNA-binding response OmpR family regulator
MRLLVVEDEAPIADAVARALRRNGYAVDVAYDGHQALGAAADSDYDAVLLDLNLPGVDGMTVCREIRTAQPSCYILMVTARTAVGDRVAGLDAGADDYLPKPFDLDELQARLRALFRRDRTEARQPVLEHGDLLLDPARQRVTRSGVEITLNRKEYGILEYFMRHPDRIVSQEDLLEHVWDREADPFTNTVRVHIMKLRRKINDGFDGQPHIHTVIGRGYRL